MAQFIIKGRRRVVQRWTLTVEAADITAAVAAAVTALGTVTAAGANVIDESVVAASVQAVARVREVEDPV